MNRISLVISDVDGSLVTHDKRLTEAAIEAVKVLNKNNIGFTITSSRPAFGMRMLIEPLGLRLPFGAFNGSLIVDPALKVLQKAVIPVSAARNAIDALKGSGIDIWLFTADRWLITHDDGRYVPHERATILTDAVVVSSFDDFVNSACKIVGVSADPENSRVAKLTCRRRSQVKRRLSVRKATISTSHLPDMTRGLLWKRWRSVWIFRRATLPPSEICKTIWPCSARAACHLPWATPTTP